MLLILSTKVGLVFSNNIWNFFEWKVVTFPYHDTFISQSIFAANQFAHLACRGINAN